MLTSTAVATATEMQNNFGHYLAMVMDGVEVVVTKNGREVGRFVPKDTAVSYLTDSLTGILRQDTLPEDVMDIKEKELMKKYALIH